MRFRDIGAYSAVAYLNQLANVLVNILFIKMLPLNTLGEISIAKVWMQAMDFSHVGLRFSLDRYAPVWGREKSVRLLWICIAISSIVSIAIIITGLIFTDNKILILVFCIWGYVIAIATILKNYYRGIGDMKYMLKTYIVCPTLPVIAQSGAFYFLGFNSFLVVTLVSGLAAILYLFAGVYKSASGVWSHVCETLRTVQASATTLFINSIIIFLSFSVDRIILNAYTTKETVGEYSIILFAFALLLIIPSTLSEFIFPKVVRSAVKSGNRFYPREILIVILPTAMAVATAYIVSPYIIIRFTSYGHLVEKIQLVTLGILPYAVTPILFHVMSALDMRVKLLIAACTVLILYALSLLWGAIYTVDKLEYFTIARVMNGYGLLCMYWIFLALYRRRSE